MNRLAKSSVVGALTLIEQTSTHVTVGLIGIKVPHVTHVMTIMMGYYKIIL